MRKKLIALSLQVERQKRHQQIKCAKLKLYSIKFSGYKIAQVLNISQPSVVAIRKKLGLKAYVKRYGPLLNEHQMKTRVYITRWWRKTNAKVGKVELRKKQKMWSDERYLH